MPPRAKQVVFRGPAAPQRFMFRSSFMDLILKKSSHDSLGKIYKTCKWFYENDPIVFCKMLDGGIVCDDSRCLPGQHLCKRIGLTAVAAKIHLDGPLYVKSSPSYEPLSTKLSDFYEKMFQCQLLKELHIDLPNVERVMLDEAAFVAGNATIVDFDCCMVGTDGTEAKVEQVIAKMTHVESLTMKCTATTFDVGTMANLVEMEFADLKFFKLYGIPPSVNLHDVVRFIENHPEAVHVFAFDRNFIPDDTAKNTLDMMIDALFTGEELKFLITYSFQDTERLKEKKLRVA